MTRDFEYRVETCVECGCVVLVHPALRCGGYLCTDCAEVRREWVLTEAGKAEVAR